MDNLLLTIGRRQFMQRCGLLALGTLIPGLLGIRLGRVLGEYVVINGWVVPLGHLTGREDA